MNIQQIIDGIASTTDNYYQPEDPMRWPFRVGMLETKLRELAFLITNQQQHITYLESQLEKKE